MRYTYPSPELAAWLDSYRGGLREALQASQRDGFRVIHANTFRRELDPDAFSGSARRHLARHLGALGLQLDGLAADFDGLGLADPQRAEERLGHLRRTLEMCAELRVPRAVVPIGGFDDQKTRAIAGQVLAETAGLADRFGVELAIRSPRGEDQSLSELLRRLSCPQLRAVVDSAGFQPGPGAPGSALDLTGVVLLRDVRHQAGRIEEVAYGAGEVDFARLLGQLAQHDYRGPLVLRRDAAGLPVDALRQGREYLGALLGG